MFRKINTPVIKCYIFTKDKSQITEKNVYLICKNFLLIKSNNFIIDYLKY